MLPLKAGRWPSSQKAGSGRARVLSFVQQAELSIRYAPLVKSFLPI